MTTAQITLPMGRIASAADVLRILRKRVWLIVLIFLAIGGGGTAGLLLWHFKFPSYTTTGYVRLEPGGAQRPVANIVPTHEQAVPYMMYDEYVRTELRNIQDDNVLNDALKTLKDDPKRGQKMFTGPDAAFKLGEELSVRPERGTQYILVSLTGRNRREITDIVNEVLRAYETRRQERREATEGRRLQRLTDTKDSLNRSLGTLADRIRGYQEGTESVTALENARTEELVRLNEWNRQLVQAVFAHAQAEAAYMQYKQMRELQTAPAGEGEPPAAAQVSPAIAEAVRRDPTILARENEKSALERSIVEMLQRFGEDYKAVKGAKTRLQELENEIEQNRAELIKSLQEMQESTLKQQSDQARDIVIGLQNSVNDSRARANDLSERLNKRLVEFTALQDEYKSKQALRDTVDQGIEEAKIVLAAAQPNISTIDATTPWKPSQPLLTLYLPAAYIIGLILGLGLAFAIELLDTGLRSPAEVARSVGIALLGSIPERAEDEEIPLDANLLSVAERIPHSLLAEAFRLVRTNILFSSDKPVRRILITSPNVGDGKTTIACNLATTLAASGTRVLLVEGNLRQPMLHRAFDLPNQVGLSNLLAGLTDAASATQATAIENLSVVTSGPMPPNPAELLGSRAMNQFLTKQAENYDTILIDGAPILLVTDNHALSRMADGVVLILRAGASTRGIAQRAIGYLATLKAKTLGAVLNGVRATRGGYFREAYRAYYDYLRPPEAPEGEALATTTEQAPSEPDKSADEQP